MTSGESRASTDAPLVIQIGFGGIGGIAAACRGIDQGLRHFGLQTAVIRHATSAELAVGGPAWRGLSEAAALPRRGRANIRALARCAKTVRRHKPRAVISHDHSLIPAAFLGFILSGRTPRIVMVEHQSLALRNWGTHARAFIGLLLSNVVVFLSEEFANQYPFRGLPFRSLRRHTVIPNAVNTEAFSPRQTNPEVRTHHVVGMASRIINTKDLRTLIRSIAILNRRHNEPHFQLEIAGDGPDLPPLQRFVEDSGITAGVSFLGALNDTELVSFYRGLDLYVQATLGETMSTSVLQALACGIPVVASDVTGISNMLVHRRTGVLVPPGDPIALAEAIDRVCHDSNLMEALGTEGRRYVIEHCDPVNVGRQYASLLAGIDALEAHFVGSGLCKSLSKVSPSRRSLNPPSRRQPKSSS